MTDTKKPTGVGEDTSHRPKIISEQEMEARWYLTFGTPKRRKKNASSKTRMEKKDRKSSAISNEEVG